MSLASKILDAMSAIGGMVKSDRSRLTALESKSNVSGTANSAAVASLLAVGGRTAIVLTANGVVVGDTVLLHPQSDLGAGANVAHYYVSAANKITVWVSNTALIGVSIPAMTWNWTLFKK